MTQSILYTSRIEFRLPGCLAGHAVNLSLEALRKHPGFQNLELEGREKLSQDGIRKAGAGRKRTVDQDPTLKSDLERLIDPVTRGDPELPRCTGRARAHGKSAVTLIGMGHQTSHRMVGELLREFIYSLQRDRKTLEGSSHPDRNKQFEHRYGQVRSFQGTGDPVISADPKRRNWLGISNKRGRQSDPLSQPDDRAQTKRVPR